MRFSFFTNRWLRRVIPICVFALALPLPASSQERKATLEKPAAPAEPEAPFTIERLETHVRFEADGSSRREQHAVYHINTEEGARQLAQQSLDYNRAFEEITIPLIRITHANSGTTDILPSAIRDQPAPYVADAPAYQDLRRKSFRILGLQPGETLELQEVTIVKRALLPPDFSFWHTFVYGGSITKQVFELDVPSEAKVKLRVSPSVARPKERSTGDEPDARRIYRWEMEGPMTSRRKRAGMAPDANEAGLALHDIECTTFSSWQQIAGRLRTLLATAAPQAPEISSQARQLTSAGKTPAEKLEALYDSLSQKIRNVNVPLGATGFHTRSPSETLASGYANAEDKFVLFAALAASSHIRIEAVLTGAQLDLDSQQPNPESFDHLLVRADLTPGPLWLDLTLEVAPFGMLLSVHRGTLGLRVASNSPADSADGQVVTIPAELPFSANQLVAVDAELTTSGKLISHVKYTLRGDNELLLRTTFHRASREQWKNLAQLLSLSDGFRGQVSKVAASDPLATRDPFTVEYDIAQSRSVNWSKSPVRLPISLPTLGLPEAPTRANLSDSQPIDLGTPLDIETRLTLRLPPRTAARAPVPTTVRRDYAEFVSAYSVRPGVLTASRRLKFLLREIPAASAADYAAFVRAVQNDEAQEFILERAKIAPAPTHPAAPRKPN